MARNGWSAANDLNVTNNPFGTTAYVFTMAIRFYCTALPASTGYLLYFTNTAETDLFALTVVSTGKARANVAAGGTNNFSASAGTFTLNAWHTLVGVYTSTTSRTVYLDGTAGATDTVSRAPSLAQTKLFIGDANGGLAFTGSLADAAMWNVGLSQKDIDAYNAGYSPQLIRPDALVEHWPIIGQGSTEPAIKSNSNILTVKGSPAAAAHPRILLPSGANL